MSTPEPERRTKRRYAHELYPHAEDRQTRELSEEVPYLYAQAVGHDTWGTGWRQVPDLHLERVVTRGGTAHLAFLADALLQGMSGQEAWEWADHLAWDETGETTHIRARHYGVPADQIKPYPCGPEPERHTHYSEPDTRGWRTGTTIDGKESDCPDCTEPATITTP